MYQKILHALMLLCLLQLNSACSTLDTNKKKIIASMAGGLIAGVAIGAAAKPEGDPAAAWMTLGGASGAAAGATIGLLIFDEQTVSDDLRDQNSKLKIQLDQLKTQNDPKLVDSGASLLNAPLPTDAKGLVKPGGWKRYRLDRWVQDNENKNVWYRQTEMFEFELPAVGGEQ